MRLLYKPFALIAAALGKLLGKQAFRAVWTEVGDSPEPPSPTTGESDIWKAVSGAALRAAMIATFVTVLRRLSARVFHNLFGVWPGKPDEPED
jgi:hypothetical protein